MIQNINNKKIYTNKDINNQNKQQTFKGPGIGIISGLRGLNNSPAIGACAVDVCSMVIPRTAIEMKNRGPQSGIEALFREGSSCIVHACVGLIGLAAATLISGKFNKEHGVKAQNIFASADTIQNMSSIWEKSQGNKDKFFEGFIQNIKGLNGKTWTKVSEKETPIIVSNLVKLSDKTAELATKHGTEKSLLKKEIKELKKLVSAQITKNTGSQASFKLKPVTDKSGKVIYKGINASLSELIDNANVLSNSFKTKTLDEMPSFVKALKANKTAATLLGVGICSAICVSIQPFNRWLTKKRTGQDGFVGVKNKQPDNSKEFKALKTGLGVAFPAAAIGLIGKPSELVSNIQFNSKIPAINHFKFIYSLTIGSRFMASRDKNELRECVIKDTLGYVNWLILGGMVSKLTARALGGKELINNPVAVENGKKGIGYAAKWLTKSSVKSFDEVLLPKAKELTQNGKMRTFKSLVKSADKATKSKIMKIAASQLAGYVYSGLVLGIGIAKLNIFITKHVEAKKNAKNGMKNQMESKTPITSDYVMQKQLEQSPIFKDFNNFDIIKAKK